MSELEKQASVDQLVHPAVALLAAQPGLFAQQGSVSASWRRRGPKTYGPYYRLRFHDGRSVRTIYLGRQSPFVDRIRQTLHTLQKPLRQRRALNQLHRQIRHTLRIDRRHVDARLHSAGLHLKGFEVRGWRTAPLRSLTRFTAVCADPIATMRLKPPRLPPVRQLRCIPQGRAAKWMRDNRPKIPTSPKTRLKAFLAAREKPPAAVLSASAQFAGFSH
jgi:hypothetical protein